MSDTLQQEYKKYKDSARTSTPIFTPEAPLPPLNRQPREGMVGNLDAIGTLHAKQAIGRLKSTKTLKVFILEDQG